jgi:hypothetical protein
MQKADAGARRMWINSRFVHPSKPSNRHPQTILFLLFVREMAIV